MTPQPHPPSTPADAGRGVLSTRTAALALVVLAALGAASLAYALTVLLGASPQAWVAAAAAAGAVALAGAPLALALLRVAQAQQLPGAGMAPPPPGSMGRSAFLALADREFSRARRYGTGAALVLVDIDRHAHLCEARGPAAGQAVLAELLRRTAPSLRAADALTSFGASQMAVFLVHADATGALDVAERIRECAEQMEVAHPQGSQGLRLKVTTSVGVVHLRPDHPNLQALVDDALQAVAAAHAAGGNCVRAGVVEVAEGPVPGPWSDRRRVTRTQPPRQSGA